MRAQRDVFRSDDREEVGGCAWIMRLFLSVFSVGRGSGQSLRRVEAYCEMRRSMAMRVEGTVELAFIGAWTVEVWKGNGRW